MYQFHDNPGLLEQGQAEKQTDGTQTGRQADGRYIHDRQVDGR